MSFYTFRWTYAWEADGLALVLTIVIENWRYVAGTGMAQRRM